jgi:hypothetical protein
MTVSQLRKPFSADEFVDRQRERDMFERIVKFEDEARVLTIRDGSDRGKSHLLKLLRHRCEWSAKPPVPVSLVPLDELKHKSAYALARSIARSLSGFGLEFEQLRAVTDSRRALLLNVPQIRGEMNAGDARPGDGGRAAGVIFEGDVTIGAGGMQLDQDLEEDLREQAVSAFLDDLRGHCAERPVVLLIDSYENCGEELEYWIPTFLRGHVFDEEQRLENLIVVLAGQHVPTPAIQDTLGDRYERMVRSVEQLSLWDPEHVEKYLKVKGVAGFGQEDVDLICAKLKRGWPLGRAVAIVEQYLREEGRS